MSIWPRWWKELAASYPEPVQEREKWHEDCHILCISHIPSEVEWEGDQLVRPGGEEASRALAELLAKRGYAIEDRRPDMDIESWTFEALKDGKTYWVNVCDFANPELRINGLELRGCLAADQGDAGPMFRELVAEMRRDPRFENVVVHGWDTEDEN